MPDAASDHPDRSLASDPAREAQIARNEVRFRRVNEAIDAGRTSDGGTGGFVCECGRLGCTTIIAVPESAYEDVRSDFRRFVVAPGHQDEADEVLEEHEAYVVVAKRGLGAEVARADDPRAREDRA